MGTHLRVFSESYSMNTNITGFRMFFKNLFCPALDRGSYSIERINPFLPNVPRGSNNCKFLKELWPYFENIGMRCEEA